MIAEVLVASAFASTAVIVVASLRFANRWMEREEAEDVDLAEVERRRKVLNRQRNVWIHKTGDGDVGIRCQAREQIRAIDKEHVELDAMELRARHQEEP